MTVESQNRFLLTLLWWIAVFALGCNRNPYQQNPYGMMGPNGAIQPPAGMMGANPMLPNAAPQLAEMQRRIQLLDDTNRTLTTQLAQAQQQMQVVRDRADLLAKQLQDTTGQLQQSLLAQKQTESQALAYKLP